MVANEGHCNRCGKIWTSNISQDICQWCGNPAICQTSNPIRLVKTGRHRAISDQRPPGQGYDHLDQDWQSLYQIAVKYAHKAMAQDREDLLHDILLTLYQAKQSKPELTSGALYRIASLAVADYWRAYYKVTNGLDCGHCRQAQKTRCQKDWLFGNCPKAIKLESLDKPIIDSEGNLTELGELIADPESLDVAVWDSETYLWEIGYPKRLVEIAYKLQAGETLTHGERTYLSKIRKREQKSLL